MQAQVYWNASQPLCFFLGREVPSRATDGPQTLQPIPIKGGIWLDAGTMVGQGHQRMLLQRNGPKVSRKQFAIDIDLPSFGQVQFGGIAQRCELRPPDLEEVPQGEGTKLWCLNMDHSIIGMRVQPVQAGTIGRNPDPLGNDDSLSINRQRQMSMDVEDGLFHLITSNAINRRIRRVDTGFCLVLRMRLGLGHKIQ